jgi:hypothetical protein
MAINVKNPQLEQELAELRQLTGQGTTELLKALVHQALLTARQAAAQEQANLFEDLMAIAAEGQATWNAAGQPSFSEADLYDPATGLPA